MVRFFHSMNQWSECCWWNPINWTITRCEEYSMEKCVQFELCVVVTKRSYLLVYLHMKHFLSFSSFQWVRLDFFFVIHQKFSWCFGSSGHFDISLSMELIISANTRWNTREQSTFRCIWPSNVIWGTCETVYTKCSPHLKLPRQNRKTWRKTLSSHKMRKIISTILCNCKLAHRRSVCVFCWFCVNIYSFFHQNLNTDHRFALISLHLFLLIARVWS